MTGTTVSDLVGAGGGAVTEGQAEAAEVVHLQGGVAGEIGAGHLEGEGEVGAAGAAAVGAAVGVAAGAAAEGVAVGEAGASVSRLLHQLM